MCANKIKRILSCSILIAFLTVGTALANAKNAADSDSVYPQMLIPGGNVIGVKLYTRGVHIVGISYVKTADGRKLPAKDAGLRIGDFITKIDGTDVDTIEDFSKKMQNGGTLSLTVDRGGNILSTEITPALSADDNSFKAGIWVRDSTAGIGTVTYYNPEDNTFGGLGHGITDRDTGKLLSLKNGKLYNAKVTSVTKGEHGIPGELSGTFAGDENYAGEILLNTNCGIFGKYTNIPLSHQPLPVAKNDEITEGKAHIYTSTYNSTIQMYEIEIVKVIKSSPFSSKGMVIKVTDPALLNKTNGIVQGMSGSPILQNGKIVGAVTHVFVNDPTRGYGIFIENMLAEAEKIK